MKNRSCCSVFGIIAGLIITVSVAGCGDAGRGSYGQASLKMAILPVHGGEAMNGVFMPLLEYLTSETGYEIQYISSLTYDGFGASVEGSGAAVVLCDPLVYLTLQRTQQARAMATGIGADGARTSSGVIVVAAGSQLTAISSLRGRTIVCVSRQSAEGYVSQALALRAAGIVLPDGARLVSCGTMEQAAAAVHSGRAAAAFLDRQTMAGPDSAGLRVLAAGAPVPTWVCAALGSGEPETASRVGAALFRLTPSNPEHAKILAKLGYARFDLPVPAGLEELGKQASALRLPY
jgi:ABC-type phosphate/phosphonate transport system substrate-binding protein